MQSMSPVLFMLLMFGVFWLLLIRPQMKRQKEHQAMLARLKKGDEVVTRGGLIGKVVGVSDAILTIELQEKVRVRVRRDYIDSMHGAAAGDEVRRAA
ncbi:MAG: preprotein translocase subunit YajC [Deltaproteobacteria bacterium]|nr:MAG: preprotein translocase subunit YajC [Deltaproteobacteria bacterium]